MTQTTSPARPSSPATAPWRETAGPRDPHREPDNGDRSHLDELLPVLYEELRALAAHHLRGQRATFTLSPTAVVHEAYLRLAAGGDARRRSRAQFFALATTVIRRVLLGHARRRACAKRGGAWRRVVLQDDDSVCDGDLVDLIALDDALTRLGRLAPQKRQVVELRFFAGLTVDEIAETLGVSPRTIARDWRFARAWLRNALGDVDRD